MKRISRKKITVFIGLLLFIVLTPTILFAGGQAETDDKIVIGMSIYSLGYAHNKAAVEGAKEKAEELGIELIVKEVGSASGGSEDQILTIIDNFITLGIDGMIQCSGDSAIRIPGVKKLNQEGIPYLTVDLSASGGYVDYHISIDKVEAQMNATQALVDRIKELHGGEIPEGAIVVEMAGWDQHDTFSDAMHEGISAVLSKYPEINVIQGSAKDWSNEGALKTMSDFISRFGDDIVGVASHAVDTFGFGVVNAFKQAGLNPEDYALTGACMGSIGKEILQNGEHTCIVPQQIYSAGSLAVELIYNMKTGKPVPQIGDVIERNDVIWAPAKVVENPWTDGAWIVMNSPIVPTEVPLDHPQLYENIIKFE